MEKYLTVTEVATLLSLKVSTVYKMVHQPSIRQVSEDIGISYQIARLRIRRHELLIKEYGDG